MPLVVKMRDLFNVGEIPTLEAFSLTFHCGFLNLELTRNPTAAALRSLQPDCRAGPERQEAAPLTVYSPLGERLRFPVVHTAALTGFPGLLFRSQLGKRAKVCFRISRPFQRRACLLNQSENTCDGYL